MAIACGRRGRAAGQWPFQRGVRNGACHSRASLGIVAGDRFAEAIIEYARQGRAAGFFVRGVVDPSLSEVRVVDT